MTDTDEKELFKQAIKEWLDEKYADIGKWFVRTILTGGVGFLVYYWVTVRGDKFP